VTNTEWLIQSTASGREAFRSIPIIKRAIAGDVTRTLYIDFLTQAYHHVRHTVPLLMGLGARLEPRLHWLQEHLVHYVEEELGHDEWILSDLQALGVDSSSIRAGTPPSPTDAMVAYAYDVVMRRDPVGFFGMVHVLEGASASFALSAADAIQRSLALPSHAMTYLRSHGHLDQHHVGDFAAIVDRLDRNVDMPAILSCARVMYWLYGNIFRGLDEGQTTAVNEPLRRSA
jgi:pyrroloquinoline quinone (PQQ) biosynthesis protein C